MVITNVSKNAILADNAKPCDTPLKRLVGLLNRKELNKGEAAILAPSNCIHSFFMRFTIDALFLDKNGKVVGVLPSFKPFQLSPIYFNCHSVIELPEDIIRLTQTKVGDIIKIS